MMDHCTDKRACPQLISLHQFMIKKSIDLYLLTNPYCYMFVLPSVCIRFHFGLSFSIVGKNIFTLKVLD